MRKFGNIAEGLTVYLGNVSLINLLFMKKINWLKLAIEVAKVVLAFFAGTQVPV